MFAPETNQTKYTSSTQIKLFRGSLINIRYMINRQYNHIYLIFYSGVMQRSRHFRKVSVHYDDFSMVRLICNAKGKALGHFVTIKK